jgi:prevent-host-death family protein
MRYLNATEASRRFSELLDSVERDDESFVVVRHGRAVAMIGPPPKGNGKAVKEILQAHPPDPDWAKDIQEALDLLEPEDLDRWRV